MWQFLNFTLSKKWKKKKGILDCLPNHKNPTWHSEANFWPRLCCSASFSSSLLQLQLQMQSWNG